MVTPCCPQCGGHLTIDPAGVVIREIATPYHILGDPIPTIERRAALGCCDSCEFVIEIDTRQPREATPDEARAIMRELAELTDRPAPLEPVPFSLTPPKAPRRRAAQSDLFGGESND